MTEREKSDAETQLHVDYNLATWKTYKFGDDAWGILVDIVVERNTPNSRFLPDGRGVLPDKPLGIEPRWRFLESRWLCMNNAVSRFRDANYSIPPQWVEEMGELQIQLMAEHQKILNGTVSMQYYKEWSKSEIEEWISEAIFIGMYGEERRALYYKEDYNMDVSKDYFYMIDENHPFFPNSYFEYIEDLDKYRYVFKKDDKYDPAMAGDLDPNTGTGERRFVKIKYVPVVSK